MEPVTFLERLLQQPVVVQLKDDRELSGRLLGCDEHMNLVLDEAQETTASVKRRLGRVVLRGSHVLSLQAPGGAAATPR